MKLMLFVIGMMLLGIYTEIVDPPGVVILLIIIAMALGVVVEFTNN